MGSSLDQIGPLTKTTEDAKILFDAIRGHDAMDSTSLPDDERGRTSLKTPKVIGVPRGFLKEGVQPDVLAKFEEILAYLIAKGYEIRNIELPNLSYGLAVYYIVMPAEVSTNLARLDGIRYGLSVDAPAIGEVYSRSRGAGFGPETRRRIILGTFVLSSGYADAYYRKARAVRELIRADFAKAFESVDVVVTPTTTSPAFRFGEKSDPLAMYLEDIFTVPVNLAGVPAISIPMGTVERDGVQLPVGFQIIAPHRGEETLFQLGKDVEQA
jgi:aspartyl-tRNA(Asn)/glutamyl-tRNA(Gln) amidotransferase subunit A